MKLLRILLIFLFYPMVSYGQTAFETPELILVRTGDFITGSSRQEREYAYQLDEKAYGHSVTRNSRWYENEPPPTHKMLNSYYISKTTVTNAQYAAFINDTSHPKPDVDEITWKGYGLIHPYARVAKYLWENKQPPAGREQHPAVLVRYADALAFAKWLSQKTSEKWRLPTEAEWEKAARGPTGNTYPWGNEYNPKLLNSHDLGPFETRPVGSYSLGASPYGVLDMAGQVYEWTSTPKGDNRHFVKGGSWDDKGCGVCRSAARHTRPDTLKHILIGFRLVREIE